MHLDWSGLGPSRLADVERNVGDVGDLATAPGLVTLSEVERDFSAQRFRPYSGSEAPTISEADAVSLVGKGNPDFYSLGTVDVGMVHNKGQVDWSHVWVIAGVNSLPDVNIYYRGPGPAPGPQPGWVQVISLIDVNDGSPVIGSIS